MANKLHSSITGKALHAPANIKVRNISGASIPALKVVKFTNFDSGLPTIGPITSLNDQVAGITSELLPDQTNGSMVGINFIEGIDTSIFTTGDQLFSDANGDLTLIPTALKIGSVVFADAVNGVIFADPIKSAPAVGSVTSLSDVTDAGSGAIITTIERAGLHPVNQDTKLDDGQPNEISSLELRTHLNDATLHRLIDDSATGLTKTYSSQKTQALLDAISANLGGRILAPTQSTTTLKAIDTTVATDFPDKTLILAENDGLYAFDRESVLVENLPDVVAPTVGVGRWIKLLVPLDSSSLLLPYSETELYEVGEQVTIFDIPFVNKIAVTVGETFVPAKWTCLTRNLKTGVISGGLITISGAGFTFDISALTGIIVDNSDPENYLVTPIDFPETLNIANTNLGTGTSQILIDVTGTVIQLAVRTVDDELQNLSLGRTSNSGGIAVNRVVETKTAYSITKTAQAFLASIGGQSVESTTFAPGATGLTLNSSDSKILSPGRNFPTDPDNPDIADVAAETPISAPKFFRTFITSNNTIFNIGPLVNEVDNNQYNPGGDVLIAVPAGKYQVQRVYTFGGTSIHVFYYGRTLYDTKEEALQAFETSDEFQENSVTIPGAFSAFVIIKEGITDWTDPDTFQIINRTGGIVGSWDRGIPSGGIGGLTAAQQQILIATRSTGLNSGGLITGTVGQTVFTVEAGVGEIIDNTNPAESVATPVVWDEFTAVALTQLATAKHTFILIDAAGGLVQIGDNSILTELDRRNKIYLGVVRHGTGTFVAAINQPQFVSSPVNQIIDLYIASGKVRLFAGNEITVNAGNTLSIDKDVGKSYGIGVNARIDANNPNIVTNAALVAPNLLKYSSVGHIDGSVVTVLDTARYDPNGATTDSELVAIAGGATRVAHRIWIESVSNLMIFQYGQATYATEDDAIAQWDQENLSLPTGLNESSYLKEILIIQNGETNLNNAVFIPVGGGGGSAASITPITVIDNLISTDPSSALSANQGRLLNLADIASGAVSGNNIILTLKDASTITITNGALDTNTNIANSNLTSTGTRIWQLANFALLVLDGTNTMFALNPGSQSLLGFNLNSFLANAGGLKLTFESDSDLTLVGPGGPSPGAVGQVITSKGNALPPTWENPNTAAASMQITTFVYDEAAASQDELRVHGANLAGVALSIDAGTLGVPVVSSADKLITTDFTPDGGQTDVTLTVTKGTEEIIIFTTLATLAGFQVTDATEDSGSGDITVFGNGFTAGTTVVATEGTVGVIVVAGDGRSLTFPYTRIAEPADFVQLTVTESAADIDVIAQLEAQESVDYEIANGIVHKFTGATPEQWTLSISGINFVGGLGSVVTVTDGDDGIGGSNGSVGIPLPIVFPGDPVIRELLVLYTAPVGQTWVGFDVDAGGKRQHFSVNIPQEGGAAESAVLYDQIILRCGRSSFNDDILIAHFEAYDSSDTDVVNGLLAVDDPDADLPSLSGNRVKLTDNNFSPSDSYTMNVAMPYGQQAGVIFNLASPSDLSRVRVMMFAADARSFFEFEVLAHVVGAPAGEYVTLVRRSTTNRVGVSPYWAEWDVSQGALPVHDLARPRLVQWIENYSGNNLAILFPGNLFPHKAGHTYQHTFNVRQGFGVLLCNVNVPANMPNGAATNNLWHYLEIDGSGTNIDTARVKGQHNMGSTELFDLAVWETKVDQQH